MLFDITRPLSERTAVYPGDTPVTIVPTSRLRDGANSNVSSITMSVHAGTHIDAPRHYADGEPGVDALDLAALTGPARVVTLDVAQAIDVTDLAGSDVVSVPALLVHTRGSDTPSDVFDPSFVYLTPAAAVWLGEHGIRLVGIDTPSVDPADSTDLPVHHIFLRYGIVIIENLDLRLVSDGDYRLLALPLRIADCDAAPARVLLETVRSL
ncbi:MAG TPA: cyclase family protein [Anaerolineae bacterium]|jgi:arylformamidase